MNLKDKITYVKYNKNKIIIKIFVTSAILGLTGITLDSKLIITTRDKQITELKSKQKDQVENLEENINLLDKQYDVLQDKLDGKSDAYDKVVKEKEELHKKNDELEAANEKLKKEVQNFQEKRKESDQSSKDNKSKQIIKNEDKKVKNEESVKEGFYRENNGGYSRKLHGVVTAYTNNAESTGKSVGHPDYGRTASGEMTRANHTIAMDRSIPFGTKVKLGSMDSPTTYVVTDRGGAISGSRVDLYVPTVSEAMKFGKQEMDIYILN